ncbi:2,4-dienoyl-CoA reductase [(3E)-enoyl-CoA-producing] [Plasmodiophora brassicae]|uniref:2,4-dienoyl-CoA reductase [(3E)-enoyl-CoA-producing] n=1 Tax=Plasmodiophora brassicae TaxID=37360 RepID=A0A0G4IMC8_PLABS|nr:hypothetical protein PBRA_004926 [Plasmodiophora brassicae]SPQ99189.1 unnamed protein product [Plasmodiophora brassicae]
MSEGAVGDDIACLTGPVKTAFRDDVLAGRVAFVSGGGTGICFRIVEYFLRHGARVAIGSRRLHVVESAKAKLEAATGGDVLAVQLDVRSPESVDNAIKATLKQWGRLDILVNGAAGNFLSPAEKLSARAFKTVIDIDCNGTFLMSQAAFKQGMKKNGGVIINITATLHWNGQLFQAHAGSAKAAIEGMTRHLANEWGPNGVRVNNIAPGPIDDTVGFRKLGGDLAGDSVKFFQEKIALRRFGKTEDIANAALYLASDASSYVTGSTVTVDGGSWFFIGDAVGEFIRRQAKAKKQQSKL